LIIFLIFYRKNEKR